MPRNPASLVYCQPSGDMSCQTCVVSQSLAMSHRVSTSLSRKACSSALRLAGAACSRRCQSGLPLNSSASHHTVPDSIAARSVSDIAGMIVRNRPRALVVNSLRRRGLIASTKAGSTTSTAAKAMPGTATALNR
ncbi:hypothetical protein PFLmoz3_02455 [Pseudomonas fluorescens]|uniref:Uncharacterized protein n=1 Tax=Pseudomonas fluorescens TaxID=294 RepID=A0A120G7T6_PSEFL|nr:hypothetical protein PFLmoz3_02455 [Pseudomonas fluorescens]